MVHITTTMNASSKRAPKMSWFTRSMRRAKENRAQIQISPTPASLPKKEAQHAGNLKQSHKVAPRRQGIAPPIERNPKAGKSQNATQSNQDSTHNKKSAENENFKSYWGDSNKIPKTENLEQDAPLQGITLGDMKTSSLAKRRAQRAKSLGADSSRSEGSLSKAVENDENSGIQLGDLKTSSLHRRRKNKGSGSLPRPLSLGEYRSSSAQDENTPPSPEWGFVFIADDQNIDCADVDVTKNVTPLQSISNGPRAALSQTIQEEEEEVTPAVRPTGSRTDILRASSASARGSTGSFDMLRGTPLSDHSFSYEEVQTPPKTAITQKSFRFEDLSTESLSGFDGFDLDSSPLSHRGSIIQVQ